MGTSDPADEQAIPLQDEWMLKACDMYRNEYEHCTSFRSRIEQYYVFGRMLDCSQWKKDYENCFLWEKYKTKRAYDELVQSEKERRMERLKAHHANNVWERREKPPDNWNKPLTSEPAVRSASTVKTEKETVANNSPFVI